jgi:hypothetical protein
LALLVDHGGCKYILYYILLRSRSLIKYSYCDNGTEFKGELLSLLQSHGIPVINGRAYHPQTQGSVEKANDIFKQRLYACQAECNTKEWVRFLPEIARVVNSVRTSCVPPRVTPFEVFFGRKPHWLTESLLNMDNQLVDENSNVLPQLERSGIDENDSNSDSEYPETDAEDAEYILTELERQVKQSNARTAARMVKKLVVKQKYTLKTLLFHLLFVKITTLGGA